MRVENPYYRIDYGWKAMHSAGGGERNEEGGKSLWDERRKYLFVPAGRGCLGVSARMVGGDKQ